MKNALAKSLWAALGCCALVGLLAVQAAIATAAAPHPNVLFIITDQAADLDGRGARESADQDTQHGSPGTGGKPSAVRPSRAVLSRS